MTSLPLLPIESDPIAVYRDLDIPQVRSLLDEALTDVRLGAHDRRVVNWLKHTDLPTIVTIASIITRARHQGVEGTMTELNSSAHEKLQRAGIDPAEWIRRDGMWPGYPSEDGQWHGDECGCTDDECIGYHHDADQECPCLPGLIAQYQRNEQADRIWRQYRQAVDEHDQDAYQDAWNQAQAWIRKHYPRAETFSLDTLVNGMTGISITVHLPDEPVDNPAITNIGDGEYRDLVWPANENPWDTWGPT